MLKLKNIPVESYEENMKLDSGKYLPTLYFDEKQVPEIKDWEVGEEYDVVLRLKQTSKNENELEPDENNLNAGFNIVAYKVLDSEMSDADLEKLQAEALKSK